MTKKKIIWTINSIFPEAAEEAGLQIGEKGHWLYSLFNSIKTELNETCTFHIIHLTLRVKDILVIERENTCYHLLPMRKYAYLTKYKKELQQLRAVVGEIKPDLIHVHGTEDVYGLITRYVDCPVVVSLQGIRNEIRKHYFSDISRSRYFRLVLRHHSFTMLKNLIAWRIKTQQETEIIQSNRLFIGRTLFDKACVLAMNPTAEYLMGDDHRIIREDFYSSEWNIDDTEDFSLHATLSESTFKGVFLLIEAVKLVKDFYPGIKVSLAGSFKGPIGREVRKTLHRLGLTDNFTLPGRCSAEQLISFMLKARLFVHPSYMDNSPNSLQEAQILGMPVIASFTGGIPSLIEDRRTGLFFPRGDSKYLARQIIELLGDRELAIRLGKESRKYMETRNNPGTLSTKYCQLYNMLLVREESE